MSAASVLKIIRKYALPRVLLAVGLWAFITNAIWEFGHAGPLYDMWSEVSFASGLFFITLAILGDVLIVFGVAFVSCCAVGAGNVLPPRAPGWVALLGVGLAAAVSLEWAARSLDWWTYNARMPTTTVFGETVGLSPLLQITILPALSVYLGFRIPLGKTAPDA